MRRVEDLFEGLAAGLAGLGLHGVEQRFAALEQQVVRLEQHAAAVREAGRAPGRLRDARGGGGIRDVLGGAERQVVQHLAGEGGDHASGVARGGREVARSGRPAAPVRSWNRTWSQCMSCRYAADMHRRPTHCAPRSASSAPATLVRYAAGSLGTGGFATLPGLVLVFFLTDTLGVAALVAGLLVTVAKVWDVIIDPVIGARSDHSLARHRIAPPLHAARRDPAAGVLRR